MYKRPLIMSLLYKVSDSNSDINPFNDVARKALRADTALIYPWNTVKELKDEILLKSTVPAHLTLMSNFNFLSNERKLSECGVKQDSDLMLYVGDSLKEQSDRRKRKIRSLDESREEMKLEEPETLIRQTQDRRSEGSFTTDEASQDPQEKQDPLELMWKRLCQTQVCGSKFSRKTCALSFKLSQISSRLDLRKPNLMPWRRPPPIC